jgi:signal transduction histidine kinase
MRLLENRDSRGAFGTNRLDTVRLIAGQLSVSLDNALLYTSLEQQVADRTHDLREANHQLQQHRDHLEELVEQRTQELSRAKEQAETASIAKSAFLANTSHEIRTPLNAISGMAYMIRRAGLTPRQAEQMGKLEAASNHLLKFISDILELSVI